MKNLPMLIQLASFTAIFATCWLIALAMIDPLLGLAALLCFMFTFVNSAD